MTINIADNSPRISYSVGDGVTQTSFTVPFEFFDDEDLNVYVDGTLKTLTSDYTVSGGDGSTGTITMSVTGASGGSTVVITRDITLERTTDFPVSGAFNIVALNTELDRLIAVAADLDDRASRALQLTDYDVSVGLTLPVVDTRKGKTLAFNATTGAVEAGPSIADTQSVADASADIALLADIQDGTIATNALTNLNSIRTDVTTVSGISANVTTVATNNANVTTVATNDTNITTVAGSIANVNAVGNSIANVNTTASNIASVNTVAGEIGVTGVVTIVANAITDVSTVSGDIAAVITAANDLNEAVSEIDTVANAITNVDLVGTNIANVNTVAGISADVTTVAADGTDIGIVAGISSNVTTVAGISANVTTVAGVSSGVTTVAGISADVSTVSGISSNVTTVANNSANVTTVAGISSDVTTVAGVSSDVTTVATNLTSINSFANTYRIGTTDPTTSLDTGDLFYNTSSSVLKVYNGTAWEAGVTAGSGFLPLTGGTMTGALDVQSTITADGLTVDGNFQLNGDITVTDTSGDPFLKLETGQQSYVLRIDNDASDIFHVRDVTNSANRIGVANNGDISFYEDTGTTAKFFWDASAESLGIGTSSPSFPSGSGLSIYNSTIPRINFKNSTTGTASTDGGEIFMSGSTMYIQNRENSAIVMSTNGTNAITINNSQNVGIGTSSPNTALHVSTPTTTKSVVETTGTSSDALIEFTRGQGSGNTWSVGLDQSNGSALSFAYLSNGSPSLTSHNKMTIDSSGNVGIGTTSPTSRLNIRGSSTTAALDIQGTDSTIQGRLYADNAGQTILYADRLGNAASPALRFYIGTSERMRIDSSGNLLVGTTTSPSGSNKLFLAKGLVETTTTVSYAASIALTYDNGSIQTVTLTGNVSFTDSLADGESVVLMLNAGASYTVIWPTMTWTSSSGNVAPTLTANDTLVFWKIGTTLYGAYAGSYT